MAIKQKPYTVDRTKSTRPTHSLSSKPGGAAVYVEYYNGMVREYKDVKSPQAYIQRIWDNDEQREIRDIWTI